MDTREGPHLLLHLQSSGRRTLPCGLGCRAAHCRDRGDRFTGTDACGNVRLCALNAGSSCVGYTAQMVMPLTCSSSASQCPQVPFSLFQEGRRVSQSTGPGLWPREAPAALVPTWAFPSGGVGCILPPETRGPRRPLLPRAAAGSSSARQESPRLNINASFRERRAPPPTLTQEALGCSPRPCSPQDWSPRCLAEAKVREGQPSCCPPSTLLRGPGGFGEGTHVCTHTHTHASTTGAHTHTHTPRARSCAKHFCTPAQS